MTRQEFYEELKDVLESEDSVKGDELLSDLGGWDSLAVMTYIAMVDEQCGVTLSASKLAEAVSVEDLITMLGDKISD